MRTSGPTTVPALLGREVKDERDLSLTQVSTYVLKLEGKDESLYAVVLGQWLGRRELMDLLFSIAPYKAHGPDDFSGVLDDWYLFDRGETQLGV